MRWRFGENENIREEMCRKREERMSTEQKTHCNMKKIHRKKERTKKASNKKRNASPCKHTSHWDDPTMKAGTEIESERERKRKSKNRHHATTSKREYRMREKLMKCLLFGSCIHVIWILPMRIKFNFISFYFFVSRWYLHNDPCCCFTYFFAD